MKGTLLLSLLLLNTFILSSQDTTKALAFNQVPNSSQSVLPLKELDSSDIYPTIAENFIVINKNVNMAYTRVRIEDVTGVVFFDKQLQGNRMIDVSDFKAGTYIIKIATQKEIALGQFVKR